MATENVKNEASLSAKQPELISKKELLAKYGISYGALYRWKRIGLIPEEWFIKKSAVTGQETFFPRALVCERIELILSSKDEQSLEEIAQKLSAADNPQTELVIESDFGKRVWRLDEIKSIVLQSGGKQTDLTEIIQNFIKKGE